MTPLTILGSLKLPAAMTFFVDTNKRPDDLEGVTVIEPAQGIVGDCTWTCGGGLSQRATTLFAADGVLKLDYKPTHGIIMIIR